MGFAYPRAVPLLTELMNAYRETGQDERRLEVMRRLRDIEPRPVPFREWTSGEQAQHDEFRRATQGQGSERSRRRSPPPPPRPKTALQRAYDVIGCSSTDDDAAVRRAYRLAAKKCHPDVLRAAGASEGRIAVATEQMARINDAWDTICKARGM